MASLTLRCQFCETWNRVDTERAGDRPKCGHCARFLLLDRPFALFKDTFARTIAEAELPVFVDFYADWCGPCKAMAPAVDELALRNIGAAFVAKLNTDLAPDLGVELGIRGIPTSIVFKGGKEIARASGNLPIAALQGLLDKAGAAA